MADQNSPRSPNGQAGITYWNTIAANDNGMLGGVPSHGGFASISRIDLQGSRTFLARLGIGTKNDRKQVTRALDAGAGIGRISKGLLLNVAQEVNVVEPVVKFTDQIRGHPGIGSVFNVGLENWFPDAEVRYDLVWTQWCLGHLSDDQVVGYLERCRGVLTPGGIIVVKENLSTGEEDLFDETDSSVTRRDDKFRTLFDRAGLKLIKTDEQRGFPESGARRLFPVRMYALKPE